MSIASLRTVFPAARSQRLQGRHARVTPQSRRRLYSEIQQISSRTQRDELLLMAQRAERL